MYLIWCWCFFQMKLLHFRHLNFKLLFKFSRSIMYVLVPAIPSTHLKHRSDFVWAFSTSGFRETSLIPGTRCILLIILICNPFKSRYLFSVEGSTKALRRLYVKWELVDLMLLSPRMVLAFDLHVLGIKARAFKCHLFDFILVEWLFDNESTTSTPPFLWSYIVCTCGFFLFLVDVGDQHDIFLLVWYTYKTDLSSRSFNALTSLGIPFLSWCMVWNHGKLVL